MKTFTFYEKYRNLIYMYFVIPLMLAYLSTMTNWVLIKTYHIKLFIYHRVLEDTIVPLIYNEKEENQYPLSSHHNNLAGKLLWLDNWTDWLDWKEENQFDSLKGERHGMFWPQVFFGSKFIDARVPHYITYFDTILLGKRTETSLFKWPERMKWVILVR
jgi:hypothetical protein